MRLSDLKQYSVVSTNPTAQNQPPVEQQPSQAPADANLGTGFNPSFESKADDSV